jgi:AraC-like DNA-binding protein
MAVVLKGEVMQKMGRLRGMNFYQQEILRIRRECLPCEAVIDRCREAKRLMDERFCAEVDLDGMAESVFVSKFHFVRQFSRVYGQTPHRYLTERRMEAAKELLAEGLEVGVVCWRVGFSSVPSFTAVFKRYIGWTPAAYGKMRAGSA